MEGVSSGSVLRVRCIAAALGFYTSSRQSGFCLIIFDRENKERKVKESLFIVSLKVKYVSLHLSYSDMEVKFYLSCVYLPQWSVSAFWMSVSSDVSSVSVCN